MLQNRLLLLFLLIPFISFSQVNANFSADITEGCGTIPIVQFTDLSSGNITSWQWNLGNSNTSILQNPTASYNGIQNYDVQLIVSDGTNFDTLLKSAYIKVYRNPTADFSFSPDSGCNPLTVNFTNASVLGDAPIQDYIWDFRDGTPNPGTVNPTQVYNTPGIYNPNLQIIDTNGCTDNLSLGPITVFTTPVASFTTQAATVSCIDSLMVNFNNTTTGTSANTTYLWDFGDGGTSTLENPSHLYRGYNQYTVSLTVMNPNCTSSVQQNNFVQLQDLIADFTLRKKEFCYKEKFDIRDASTGAASYSWDFGDGTGSTDPNPTKIYADSGFFEIGLTVSSFGCVEQKLDTVYVERVIADFITDTTFICNQFDSVFYYSTSTNAVSYRWELEDDYPDDGPTIFLNANPRFGKGAHIEGAFTDKLSVTSRLGCTDKIVKDSNRIVDFIELFIIDDNGFNIANQVKGCTPVSLTYNSRIDLPKPNDSVSYAWNFGNGQQSNALNPSNAYTYNEDTTVVVSLSVTTSSGCRMTDEVIITLGYPVNPIISILDDTLCQMDTLYILSNNPGDTVVNELEYIVKNVTSGATQIQPFMDATIITDFPDTGYFDLFTVHSYNECAAFDTLDSAVYIKGPIVKNLRFSSPCDGSKRIDFSGILIDADRFYWDFDDGSPLDSIHLNPMHTYLNNGTYFPTLTAYNDSNDCGPVTKTIQIEIDPSVQLTVIPKPLIYCLGDSIKLKHNMLGQADTTQWYVNNVLVGDTLTFDTLIEQRGSYPFELRVVDFLGCPQTYTTDIYISRPQADFDFIFLNGCMPVDVELTSRSIVDTLIKTEYWIRDNLDTLWPPSAIVNYDKEGQYGMYYYIENIYGCTDTLETDSLFSLKPFTVKLRSDKTNICVGDSVTFRNTSTGLTPEFIWDFKDGTKDTTNIQYNGHRFLTVGTYDVTLNGTDVNGCALVDTKTITVESKPTIGFTADTLNADCYPLAVNFQDTSSGASTNWEWRFGDGDTSFIQNPFHNYNLPGSFDVFLKVTTANGCSDSITKPNYINTTGPTASFSMDKRTICLNEQVTFTIIDPLNVQSFIWDFGDGNSGTGNTVQHTYRDKTGTIYVNLALQDSSNLCNVSILDSLTVYDIKADFTVSNDTGCAPHTVTFTNTSIGEDSFQWNLGQGSSSNNTQEQITYQQSGSYQTSLAISSVQGCLDTAYKTIHVFNNPIATITSDTGICIGDSVMLIASGGTNYAWSPPTFISSTTNDTVIVYPDSTTLYSVIVSTPEGCEDSSQTEVIVIQQPNPNSGLLDSSIIIGEDLDLDVNAGNNFNYRWTPSDGLSCDDCPNPNVKPLRSQTYILNISDDFGCFNINDTITISVAEMYSLDVPKAFTPNGDGVNDIIYVKGWGLKDLISFKIYNRFGELIFESTDFNVGWNGKYRGKEQNIETYIYTVEALTFGNRVLSKKGNISLLK